jgi:hypothetical protein
MKSMLRSLGLLGAIVVTSASAHAATVVFGPATAFSSATVLDNPYNAGYTFVSAMNVGDSAKTFDTPGGTSITFAAGTGAADLGDVNMPAAASATTGYYNGNAQWNAGIFAGGTGITAFDDILRGNAWHTNGSDSAQPLTLRLTGLTIGETYSVYLYSVDVRAGSAGRAQAYWDGFASPNFTGNTSGSFAQDAAMVVQGTFTADAALQDIFIQETDGVGNDDTHLSAYTLYAVPEPSSALLLTGAGLLVGFRRKRR